MADPRITAVRSIELGVTNAAKAADFYCSIWGLSHVATEGGVYYLRATGPEHHVVVLHPRPKAELVRVNMAVPDEESIEALHAKAKAYGLTEVEDPAPIGRPGGGYGFAFKDFEGRNLAVSAGVARHADTASDPDRPTKLSHVVLNADDPEKSVALFTELLGFTLIDQTRGLHFLNCNDDHHSIAMSYTNGPTLHHIAFEMPDLDGVMRGAGRMKDSGYPIEWGVGRHGPGNNVFSYFLGPDDFVIEYTSEVEQVDGSYRRGGPDDWGFPAGRTDQWGVTLPPTERIGAAQKSIGFAKALGV